MIRVYVCEDNAAQRENISTIIKNYLLMQDYDAVFEWTGENPNDLLSYVDSKGDKDTGLFFLDVDLNTEMNGISLGGELKRRYPDSRIVFITTHAELSYLTFLYKVEAMDYIPKDDQSILKARIIECIDVAVERHLNGQSEKGGHIVVQCNGISVKLNVKEIQFIESSGTAHRLVIHLDNRQVEYYGKIKEIEEWDSLFYRCHQSCVVNLENIESIDRKKREIIVRTGEICYVSTRYLKGLIEKLEELGKRT